MALFDVKRELTPVTANWKNIGIALRLNPNKLNSIESANHCDPAACLTSMVTDWLNMNYDVEKFGEPTWRWLVQAVGDPAGGDNMALARKIARSHKVGTKKVVASETRQGVDDILPNLLDKSTSSTHKTDSGETSKNHKAESGSTETGTGESSKSNEADCGTTETDISRKHKAASGPEVLAVKKTKVEGKSNYYPL